MGVRCKGLDHPENHRKIKSIINMQIDSISYLTFLSFSETFLKFQADVCQLKCVFYEIVF